MPDSSFAWPLAQILAKETSRSSTVRPYRYILSLVIGAWHLTQTKVCPQTPQSFIFLILGNIIEPSHQNLSPRGYLCLCPWATKTSCCPHLPTGQRERRHPLHIIKTNNQTNSKNKPSSHQRLILPQTVVGLLIYPPLHVVIFVWLQLAQVLFLLLQSPSIQNCFCPVVLEKHFA